MYLSSDTLTPVSLYVAAQGTQFITGACTSDADCAAGCCGFNTGKVRRYPHFPLLPFPLPSQNSLPDFLRVLTFSLKCAGPIVALERDGGCGFGDAQPNDNAAQALRGNVPNANANANPNANANGNGNANAEGTAPAPAPPAQTQPAVPATNVTPGTQFITGACTSDADCAAGCCGFKSGKVRRSVYIPLFLVR